MWIRHERQGLHFDAQSTLKCGEAVVIMVPEEVVELAVRGGWTEHTRRAREAHGYRCPDLRFGCGRLTCLD